MADFKKRLSVNVEGEFFVDSTCINCDACRQLAPQVFADSGDDAFVYHQPSGDEEKRSALRALLACPTGSIGTVSRLNTREVAADFPLPIEDGVYYCGFNSPKSYGGNSYFVERPEGNWLIDSPKFLPHLVERLEAMGGIKFIFLTHRDDVAEAGKYAERFSSRRIIHRHELSAQPGAETVFDGKDTIEFHPEFLIIPTPGHTRGHAALLYKRRFLFTGDHLAWDRDSKQLDGHRDYCWWSWPEQMQSMARLEEFEFEWVLPGHGQRVKLPVTVMKQELTALVRRMRAAGED